MRIAKMTGGTFIRKNHPGMFVAWIHRQHFGRAEFHADTAAFAPGGIQDNLAARAFFACASTCGTGERGRGGRWHGRLQWYGCHKEYLSIKRFCQWSILLYEGFL
jgi:hypothetical protein